MARIKIEELPVMEELEEQQTKGIYGMGGLGYNRAAAHATGTAVQVLGAVVQRALRQSYLETSQDLQFYADNVRVFNGVKRAIRSKIKRWL